LHEKDKGWNELFCALFYDNVINKVEDYESFGSEFKELEKDENLEVVSVLTKDWNKDLKKVDLIVLHEPGLNADPASWLLIEKSKIPVLMSIGPNSTSAGISGKHFATK
jgi:hypothetical protein